MDNHAEFLFPGYERGNESTPFIYFRFCSKLDFFLTQFLINQMPTLHTECCMLNGNIPTPHVGPLASFFP